MTTTFPVSPDDPEAADCPGDDEVPEDVDLSARRRGEHSSTAPPPGPRRS